VAEWPFRAAARRQDRVLSEPEHVTVFSPGLPSRFEPLLFSILGEVAEWPNVTDSKSVVLEMAPGVRIPPSPPFKAKPQKGGKKDEMRTTGFDAAKRRWDTIGGLEKILRSKTNPSFSAI
jgi:hypothetical protein